MKHKKQKHSNVQKKKSEEPQVFVGRVAVFIDAANLEKSVEDLGTKPPQIKRIPKGFQWKALPKGHYKIDYKKLW